MEIVIEIFSKTCSTVKTFLNFLIVSVDLLKPQNLGEYSQALLSIVQIIQVILDSSNEAHQLLYIKLHRKICAKVAMIITKEWNTAFFNSQNF